MQFFSCANLAWEPPRGYMGIKGVGGREWWVQLQPGLHITVALIIVVISVEG